MKTDIEPWKINLEPQKTMKTYLEPWKTNLELWKTMKNQPGNMKNQPGTRKNHENRPGTINNQPETMNTHENRPGTINKQKRYRQTNRTFLLYIDFHCIWTRTRTRKKVFPFCESISPFWWLHKRYSLLTAFNVRKIRTSIAALMLLSGVVEIIAFYNVKSILTDFSAYKQDKRVL